MVAKSMFGSLAYRTIGAAMLDRGTYEGVEHDPAATWQATVLVVASSLAAGIGASGWQRPRLTVLVAVTAVALIAWLAWAVIIVHIGGRYLAQRQTEVTIGQMLRTVGFAASPGLFQIFASVSGLTVPIYIASWLWMLAAMTVAVRQALDYRSIGRALAVCSLGLALVLIMAVVIALLFSPAAA